MATFSIVGEKFFAKFYDADGNRMRGLKVETCVSRARCRTMAQGTVATLADNGVKGVTFKVLSVVAR